MKKIFIYTALLIVIICFASVKRIFMLKDTKTSCDKKCKKMKTVASSVDFSLSPVSHFLIGI